MNEQQLREATRGIAEADPVPDEEGAWQRIRGGIDADQRSGRRRTILGVSGLAIAGAAAALVLVTGTGDGREAVEVIPSDTSTTADTVSPSTSTSSSSSTTTTSSATSAVGGLGGSLPARPVAVVVEVDGGPIRLDLYDADTGALVTRDLARGDFGIQDVSVVGETVYFTEELGGDNGIVRMVRWEGSAGPTTPFDLEAGTRSGILSPDGSRFASAHGGGTTAELPSISIIDVDSGEQRTLSWAADDEEGDILRNGPIGNLQWSPDGERLLFRSSVHGWRFSSSTSTLPA